MQDKGNCCSCVKEYDFFAQSKKDFYSKFTHKSILCQGKHWEKKPLVTILITTYKRPELLRQALESALNQKGFDDYQIIIADNEGRPIEEVTPTARVVKDYQDDRIIYYRHSKEVQFKSDSAVRLARSPWIVFLHDDDILSENHLAIMTDIVKKHKEIKFLGCSMQEFTSVQSIKFNDTIPCDYTVVKYLKDTTCLGDWAGWLGALISRKRYIAMGGMPSFEMGNGDLAMVAMFHHCFGTYGCHSNQPLYYYRKGEQQVTYTLREIQENNRINAYYFYKYVISRCHKLTHRIWERNIAYITLEECERYNNTYCANIDIDNVISECNMPTDIKQKNVRYYMTKSIFNMYRKLVRWLDKIFIGKMKKSDIHMAI